MAERDELALAMLAAWLNVQPDQIPAENRAHLNPHTREAWARVGDAARQTIAATYERRISELEAQLANAEPGQ